VQYPKSLRVNAYFNSPGINVLTIVSLDSPFWHPCTGAQSDNWKCVGSLKEGLPGLSVKACIRKETGFPEEWSLK